MNSHKGVICKNMFFSQDSEYQQFMLEYESIDRKPFSVLYPRDILISPQAHQCTTSKEVKIYFDIVGEPLSSQVQSQGLFSETKGWFLLNQLSKALEVMEEHGRSHLAISPETVYCNSHGNYLLYDSLFVLGRDPTSFLKDAKVQRAPLTPKMSKIVDRHSYPSRQEAKEQDMYTVGLTLLFALTGINPKKLSPEPARPEAVEQILDKLNISRQMKHMLSSLIDPLSFRRMDNNQLRRLLKDKEASIIKNQRMQFIKSSQNYRFSSDYYETRQEKPQDKRKQRPQNNIQLTYSPKISIKPSQTSLYQSRDPSMKSATQLSISNNLSRKIIPQNNHFSTQSMNYRPAPLPVRLVVAPQQPKAYPREQILSRVRSADTLGRW